MPMIELYFGFHGRIGRKTFWLASIAPGTVQLVAWGGYGVLLVPHSVLAFAAGVAAFAMAMLNSKRLHDRDKSGWWQIIGLISLPLTAGAYAALHWQSPGLALGLIAASAIFALAGLWILIDFWFLPGTDGGNRFGPAPPKAEDIARRLEREIDQMQPITARLDLANMPPPSGVIERKGRSSQGSGKASGFGRRDAHVA